MSEVYDAIEEAEETISNVETVQEIIDAIESVSNSAAEVVEQYRTAAENFGGVGENAERADELEGWQSELESFAPDEPEEAQVDQAAIEAQMEQDGFSRDDEAEWVAVLEDRVQEAEDELEQDQDALEDARSEAQDLLNNCPL
jgi:hypothetical protein